MDSTSADSRKSSRRRHTKNNGKKHDGSSASRASSSSASSSLASSRVSTPSIATNASASSGQVATTSSSSTSATSDSRLKFHYDRDVLMELKSSRLSHKRPAGFSSDHETDEGVWDPDRWFASVSTVTVEKRKQPADTDFDTGLRKRPSGNGSKSAAAEADDDDEHISLAPQRSSFLTGCQVKRSAAGPDSKRDGRDRREAARIGSGRIHISERLADKEQWKDDRGGRYGHDRHRDGYGKGADAGDRRRADRDADDVGRGRFSRDNDNGYSGRLDRDEGFRSDRYDRDDSRASKSRLDRDRDDLRYDSRRKDGSFRNKNDYMDRREGDRRLNKYNESSGGYGRSYPAAEPEWFTEGPISQSDTIELRGFDTAHSDRPRTRNTSGSDASHDGSRLDREKVKPGRRDKVDGGGKTGGAKNKENSLSNSRDVGETASDTLLNDERREESDRDCREPTDGQSNVSAAAAPSSSTNDPTTSSQNASEFDFNEFFRIDSAALGLGVDELAAVNSTAGSRLWKWSGRAYADDTQHSTLTNDSSVTSQRDGDGGQSSGLIDTKALLSLLHKSDHQTPSLPSLYLDSRLAPDSTAAAPPAVLSSPAQGKVTANVQALLDSACQPSALQPVLPAGGKVVRLEELEASQLSPPHKPSSLVPSSSTPADGVVSSALRVNVSRDSVNKRQRGAVAGTGPVHGHVPPGPTPALPAGAQVQTVEEIEAGLRGLNMPPSPPVNNADVGTSATGGGAGGDLTAFNKLLHLVNKTQPATSQAPTAVKSMQQEAMTTASSADSSAAAAVNAAAGLAPLNVSSELSQAGPVSMAASQQHPNNPVVVDNSAVLQQQQQQHKLYQLHQHQLYLHHQQQMMLKDPQLLMAYLQQAPNQPQQPLHQPPGPDNISPQMLQQQQLRSYSPRAPSPIMFGSQPPISIAAPLPIHSRQRLPFANMVPPPVQQQSMAAVQPAADAVHLAAVHSVIQKQLHDQKRQAQQQLQQQPAMMMPPSDRISANASAMPANSQLPSSAAAATKPTGTSFIPTSVIRNMAGQRTADDRLSKDGEVMSMNEGPSVVMDASRHDPATAAASAALRLPVDGVLNGPASYQFAGHPAVDSTVLSSPNSRQQLPEHGRSRRPLIGQGAMNAADVPPPPAAANFTALQQNVAAHVPMGRPIVKGQMPFNLMGQSSSSSSGVSGAANCLTVEHLQLMSQLAQQQQQQQPRAVYPPLDAAVLGHGAAHAGYVHQPTAPLVVNNAPVRPPQPTLRASGPQCMPVRPLPSSIRPFDNSDKHPDAIALLLASGVADHRLPNVPAQLAMTVDELECAAAPPAAN